MRVPTLRFAILCACAFSANGFGRAQGIEIHGAGATFPAPVYAAWADAYRRATGTTVRYDAVGSGKGLELIRAHEVDFGASDVPLDRNALDAAGLLEFPAVIGGVVPVVNLHGIGAGELRLSGDVLSAIFSGRITHWNDDAIKSLNPSLHLPGSRITVVHRDDASGTSFLWTDYLSREDARWKHEVGRGTIAQWPTGVAGTGNEGVASYVQRTRASIGYVEYAYARAHRLSDVSLRDASGDFIRASAEGFAAALRSDDARRSVDDPAHDLISTGRGWPIAGASFILIAVKARDAQAGAAVRDFFAWALRDGSSLARERQYVPIPDAAAHRIIDAVVARATH